MQFHVSDHFVSHNPKAGCAFTGRLCGGGLVGPYMYEHLKCAHEDWRLVTCAAPFTERNNACRLLCIYV